MNNVLVLSLLNVVLNCSAGLLFFWVINGKRTTSAQIAVAVFSAIALIVDVCLWHSYGALPGVFGLAFYGVGGVLGFGVS
jgi:hypothetical protein